MHRASTSPRPDRRHAATEAAELFGRRGMRSHLGAAARSPRAAQDVGDIRNRVLSL
jgi:hypothetical protein